MKVQQFHRILDVMYCISAQRKCYLVEKNIVVTLKVSFVYCLKTGTQTCDWFYEWLIRDNSRKNVYSGGFWCTVCTICTRIRRCTPSLSVFIEQCMERCLFSTSHTGKVFVLFAVTGGLVLERFRRCTMCPPMISRNALPSSGHMQEGQKLPIQGQRN